MPTYEYKCTKCEEIFEIFQKITDAPPRECPVCGGDLAKVISRGIGIIFKGRGFYTTDYKNSSVSSSSSNSSSTSSSLSNASSKESEEKKSSDNSPVSTKKTQKE